MTKITSQLPIVFIITACTQTSDTACIQITADDLPSQMVFPISKHLPEYKDVTYTPCEDISFMYAKSDTGYIVATHIGDDVILFDDNTYSVNINASQSMNNSIRLSSNQYGRKFDRISYSFLGVDGDPIGTASDLTRDGEIDMKIFNKTNKTLIKID